MKVILKEQIPSLGRKNEVVEVSLGYARNFLFPRSMAVVADKPALAQLEFQRQRKEAREEKLKSEAKNLAQKLKNTTLSFKKKASDKGQLFGSITAKEILTSLKEALSWTFTADQLLDFSPLKETGEHTVKLQLLEDLTAQFQVKVEAE